MITRSRIMTLAVLLSLCIAPPVAAQDNKSPDSIFIRCYEFDRGNVRVLDVGSSYADTEPVVINGGKLPNTMEYDIDFPVTATYALFAKYAAVQSRPVDVFLDDELIVRGFKSITGSWQARTSKWEQQAELQIAKGKHCVKFVCPGPCIPHLVSFRLDSSVPFPQGWKRRPVPIEKNLHMTWSGNPEPGKFGFEAYVREDGFVDAPRDYNPIIPFKRIPPPTPKAERILEFLLMGPGKHEVEATIEQDEWGEVWQARLSVKLDEGRTETDFLRLSPERIRRMLEHTTRLVRRFRKMTLAGRGYHRRPDDGPRDDLEFSEAEDARAEGMLVELARVEAMDDGHKARWQALYDLYVRAYRLKNHVALSNPLLDFDKLLFAKRFTYNTSHIYTTYFDGSRRFGGGLCALSPLRPDGSTAVVVNDIGEQGIYRDPDLSWDGRRVLFSFKPDRPTPYRIFEVGVDGSDLRQVTDSDYDDIDPCYLPDGRIMFVSTRCRRVVLCHNAFTVSVLYTMNSDGSDVRCASPNTVNEFTPSVLSDGRVAYCRWEYVDKHLGNNQSLWAANPDGSRAMHIAGAHWGPITFWEPREIPGSSLIVTTLGPHMPIAVGPIALVDPANCCTSPAKYTSITPELPAPNHFGWNRTDVGYYCNPFPLSEDYFIVSYAYGPKDREPAGYGIYLLDRWNNRDLIYRDPDISCFEALPVRPRPRPPIIADVSPNEHVLGQFCLMDVYQGLHGIQRGDVKYLRIVEEIPKPVAANCGGYGLQYPVMSNYGHIAVKRLWGTVPIEEDGSAYFRAPANAAVYFSALDENFMEIQRMRTFTHVLPGETVSCIGCHEPRTTSPSNRRPLATRRPASDITPPPDGVHAPDFAYDVQPVLNRHCLKCHNAPQPAGGVDLSPTPTNLFNVAYETLTSRGYVNYIDVRRSDTLPLRPAKYYGSHAGKLIDILRASHKDRIDLPQDDFRRLVTWIDCNAPYYGTYLFSRPGTIGGRELLTPGIRKQLRAVFDRRCASCHGNDAGRAERVNFASLENSPALLAPLAKAAGGTQACKEAVFADREDPDAKLLAETLAKLKQEIETNPRADMKADRPPIMDPKCRYVYRP